jgi:hypothetical protein
MAATIGLAVAIGMGLLRVPSSPEDLTSHGGGFCGANAVEAGVRLQYYLDDADGTTPVTIYSDGRVSGLAGDAVTATMDRRLTAAGVDTVVATVVEAGLAGECLTNWYTAPPRVGYLDVVDAGGRLLRMAWGPTSSSMRVISPGQHAATSELVTKLENLEAWLPPDAWTDEPWHPGPMGTASLYTERPSPEGAPIHEPCELLTTQAAEEILGPVNVGDGFPGYAQYLDARVCQYYRARSQAPSAIVYLRSAQTATADADLVARSVLGEPGLERLQVNGRPAWLSGCLASEVPCLPALAISADPHFVIVAMPRDAATESALRALADRVTFPTP